MNKVSITGGRLYLRSFAVISLIILITAVSARLRADAGTCGGQMITLPFTDVPAANGFFCSIAESYFSALANGTSPTTFSPATDVTREQMAAFITRTQDSALRRGSRRAALKQWETPTSFPDSALTVVDANPELVAADGADLWVANGAGTVSRVRASDGRLLETWTGATQASGVLVARGRIFVTGLTSPGKLYKIDPRQPAGAVSTVASTLGDRPTGITTDGSFIWTANDFGHSVSRVNPDRAVTTFTTGISSPYGILYDGGNVWITDLGGSTLKKLNSDGSVAQTVPVGENPLSAVFDGTNIWVANANSNSLTVVRAAGSLSGTVLATLTGNGLNFPRGIAFDGQRILVANGNGDSVSLWKAADLTPIGSVSTGAGTSPAGTCSDGINFWITFPGSSRL